MLYKAVVMIALSSLAALGLRLLRERQDEANLEREVAGELDVLREHLFRR